METIHLNSHSFTNDENYCKIRNSVTKAVEYAEKSTKRGWQLV